MNTKCAYALVAIAALCIFILPAVAQNMVNKPGSDDKAQLNDFDKTFSDGSLDWMLLLDKSTLDNLKNMNPEEIDKLKQDVLQRLRGMSPEELDKLRDQHKPDFEGRFRDMPPADFEKFKFPWQEDKNKIEDHKPIDVKDYGYDPFKSNKIDDNKPVVDGTEPNGTHPAINGNTQFNSSKIDDHKPAVNGTRLNGNQPAINGNIPFNSSKIEDHNPVVNGNQAFNCPDQFNQNQAMTPGAGFDLINNQPGGKPGPR
jgi:hypothetical protein